MSKEDMIKLCLAESIQLEKNMAELYLIFSNCFQEDKDFWWQLAREENNHAALLKSVEFAFSAAKSFVTELVSDNFETLKKINQATSRMIGDFLQTPPSLAIACKKALALEHSAAEWHYQVFMDNESTPDGIVALFQKLNAADKDHLNRIQAFVDQKEI